MQIVGSMEVLAQHLQEVPQAVTELLQLLRHFVQISDGLIDVPDRQFLLYEAGCYPSQYLSESARQFVAKRLYAFWRKDMYPILVANLALLPEDCSALHCSTALHFLQFSPLAAEIREQLGHQAVAEETKEDKKIPRVAVKTYGTQAVRGDKGQEIKELRQKLRQIETKTVSWHYDDKTLLARLDKVPFHRYPHVIQGFSGQCRDREHKYALARLRYTMLQHQRVVTHPANLLVFINYGKKEVAKLLDQLSTITESKQVNRYTRQFLHGHMMLELENHANVFRKSLEACQSRRDLSFLFANYPLQNDSMLDECRALQIIAKVKSVYLNFASDGDNLAKLLSKHLGMTEANVKEHLQKVLVENSIHSKIEEALGDIASVAQLLKTLKKLRLLPDTQRAAEMLFHLIVNFLRDRRDFPYETLKTSLNFIPLSLQRRILGVVRKKLYKDLQKRAQKLLLDNGDPEKCWQKLLELLRNPQLESADVTFFSQTLAELRYKFERIAASEEEIEKVVAHVFQESHAPFSLLKLIIERQRRKFHTREKNVESCCEDLAQLVEDGGADLGLRRALVDLFQFYGKVDLSESNENIGGYDVSRAISRFYRNPTQTSLELPKGIRRDVANLVENAIDEERARKLSEISS